MTNPDTSRNDQPEELIAGAEDAIGATDSSTLSSDVEQKLLHERERYLRLAAEFENYKKRMAREVDVIATAAADRVIIQVLDVLDNFDRSLSATEMLSQSNEVDRQKMFESLHKGAKMIQQQMCDILKAHGVVETPALGEPFDPAQHEAVMQLESSDHPDEHVAQVLSKGYSRGGRLIRHARVGVAKSAQSAEMDSPPENK